MIALSILGIVFSVWFLKNGIKDIKKIENKMGGIPVDIAFAAIIFVLVPGVVLLVLSVVWLYLQVRL